MLGAAAVFLILVISCALFVHKKIDAKKAAEAAAQQKAAEEAAKLEEENNTLRMVAVGDNLLHDTLIDAGEENDWNYDFLYENIKKDIKEADLASVNQETPFTDEHKEAAGYPDFATPTEVGDALVKAGFDIVTQATEHAFDQNVSGVLKTLKFWKKQYPDISVLGIHKEEDESSYKIVEKKNFKIAVLNYSTLLNENHSVEETEYFMLDTYSEKKIKKTMKEAKKEADAVIVYLHSGKSDPDPDKKLRARVNFLAEQGADVIICSHPHVLKGYERFERSDGKDTLVYYSLGNFVSGQSEPENLIGGMAKFTLKKNPKTGEVTIGSYTMEPLIMHYNADFSEAGIYKFKDYTEDLAQDHGIQEGLKKEFTLADFESVMEDDYEIILDHDLEEDTSDNADTGSEEGNSEEDTGNNKEKDDKKDSADEE